MKCGCILGTKKLGHTIPLYLLYVPVYEINHDDNKYSSYMVISFPRIPRFLYSKNSII